MQNLYEIFKKYGINVDENQQKLFDLYFSHLIETNKVLNLTAITQENEVAIKHFLDSALAVQLISENAKVVDVGSGAGFPAIPLKIIRSDLEICMVDSLNKRVNFLNEVISILNLKNAKAIHSRAEDFAKTNREKFDCAVARAVAPLNTLVEYLLPLVKIGGSAIIYKASKLDEELLISQNAISTLGGKVKKIEKFTIKEDGFEDMERNILLIEKISQTPAKYPRYGNKPRTSPIK